MKEYSIYFRKNPQEYKVYLQDRIHEGILYISAISFHTSLSAQSALALKAELESIWTQINLEQELTLGVLAKIEDTLNLVFAKIDSTLALDASIGATTLDKYIQGNDQIGLKVGDLNIFYQRTSGGESAIALQSVLSNVQIAFSLGAFSDEIGVSAELGDTTLEKKLTVEDELGITADFDIKGVSHFSAEDAIGIDSNCSTTLVRYRLLSEMDDLTLEELDDMTLEELDYVTIE